MSWIFALVGLVLGIAINLCADSLPIVRYVRGATCHYCGQPRPIVAWSGLAAYLTRQHRCPSCGAPISIRHVFVELITPLLFVFCWLRWGATVTTLLNVLYGSAFILITITDVEHRLIQHVITLPAIGLAVVGAFLNPAFDSPKRALLGGGIGLAGTLGLYFFGGVFAWAMGRLRGQPISEVAFGFGDVTLTTFIGLVVGVPEVLFAIVIGMFSGGIAAAGYLVAQGLLRRKYKLFSAIPYGPFLILGGATMLYFGPEFMAWYLGR